MVKVIPENEYPCSVSQESQHTNFVDDIFFWKSPNAQNQRCVFLRPLDFVVMHQHLSVAGQAL